MVIINQLYPQVIKACRPLIIEDDVLRLLAQRFSESVARSLGAEHSAVKCNLSHVSDFPEGTEKGNFIGLEFSGKIFRLAYVYLKGNRTYSNVSRLYEFPDHKLADSPSKLLDYVANCVNNFIETYDIFEEKTILGVASSFPMEQESLQASTILQWSKEFRSNHSLTSDFFDSLKLALKKFKYTKNIYLISLVSSSTACLLSGLYKDPLVKIGLYLGDNTNISYVEKYKNMVAHTGDGLRPRTVLDVEMKSFGDDGCLDFIKTESDFQVDAVSNNPGKFVLDKLTSAAHLGEITRLCIHNLVLSGVLLDGYLTPRLSTKDALKTSDIAYMEKDEEKKFDRCRVILRKLGYRKVSDSDCLQIRFVGRCVARRSSNLMAACLTAMIQRMESKDVLVAAEGFLFSEFPNYERYLVKKITQLKKGNVKFEIRKSGKEDVAVGAGLVGFLYKDEVIRVEDKHRALPPCDLNKYNFIDLPAMFISCECDSPESSELEGAYSQKKRGSRESTASCPIVQFGSPTFANA